MWLFQRYLIWCKHSTVPCCIIVHLRQCPTWCTGTKIFPGFQSVFFKTVSQVRVCVCVCVCVCVSSLCVLIVLTTATAVIFHLFCFNSLCHNGIILVFFPWHFHYYPVELRLSVFLNFETIGNKSNGIACIVLFQARESELYCMQLYEWICRLRVEPKRERIEEFYNGLEIFWYSCWNSKPRSITWNVRRMRRNSEDLGTLLLWTWTFRPNIIIVIIYTTVKAVVRLLKVEMVQKLKRYKPFTNFFCTSSTYIHQYSENLCT